MKKILFVTGTDTGVGKTVLTAMLLEFFRRRGGRVLALKPFCSGARGDARLLQSLQKEYLTLDEVNPFYFDKAVAPAAAATGRRKNMPMGAVLGKIHAAAARCNLLLVEGVGGVMVPLAGGYTVRDLIRRLECKTIVVCPNRLGTINHTLLTAEALEVAGIKELTIVMMSVRKPDISAFSNRRMIRRMLPLTPVFCLPHLGLRAATAGAVKINVKYLKKRLAQVAGGDIVRTVLNGTKRDWTTKSVDNPLEAD